MRPAGLSLTDVLAYFVPDGALADRFGLTRGYVNSIRSGKRRRFLDTDPTIYRTLQRAT